MSFYNLVEEKNKTRSKKEVFLNFSEIYVVLIVLIKHLFFFKKKVCFQISFLAIFCLLTKNVFESFFL